jgi:UDP-N-acetylglucosamine transferase subunit ALG13
MIFVTVGAQMPFDRLVRAMDEWAGTHGRADVLAQTHAGHYHPRHIDSVQFLDPDGFRSAVERSDIVVSHAGMGSIITALEIGKPILVMPRLGRLHETRNDHQVATAKRFKALGRVMVAFDESDLSEQLDHLSDLTAAHGPRISSRASDQLLQTLSRFVKGAPLDALDLLPPARPTDPRRLAGRPIPEPPDGLATA